MQSLTRLLFCLPLLVVSFLPLPLAGQTAAVPSAVADPYAGESIVILRSEMVYAMLADGTGWRQRTLAVKVQSEAAVRQLGVIGIPFAGSSERVEIQYARVRRPDGTVIETPVADALEMPEEVTRQAPFYSDLKQKQLPVRNLRVGDTLEWQAKIVKTKAEAQGEFWGVESFSTDVVSLAETVELRVPQGKTVKVWSPTLKPVETIAGGERVYRWTSSQTKPTTGKEAEAETERKKKTVWTAEQELDAKEGKLPTIAWTTFPSWEAVGTWYRGLEGERMAPSAEVKAKVAEVTAGKATEEEKVRAVYAYVATQIRYIGVAFGVGRYQPHRATEVLENQYGDCKDKHTLLAAMLGALGVKADAVLIGAGIRFNPDVPSPAAFNHLITLATVGGKPVWLDTTAEVAPYQMLVAVTRDRQALAVPETGVARIEKTPKDPPFKSFQKMDAVGTLDKNGISESKMTLTLRGDTELIIRAVLRQVPPAQYDQLVQKISEGMSFGGTTTHSVISRAEDTVEPLSIQYDYHREKVGDWDNLKTLAQLAPVGLPIPNEKEPPTSSIELGGRRIETSTAAMKLPEGWSAELPEATHAHSAYVNWDQTYRIEKGTLFADRTVEVLVDRVPQAEWRAYKKWTDITSPGNENYVQLTRPTCAACGLKGANGPTLLVKPSNTEAAKLVESAYEAVRRHELKEAVRQLDEAKALNDTQTRLWSTYGYEAYQRGEMSEAIKDYEKELALHPDAYGTYRSLAGAHMNMGKQAESIAVLRRWVSAEPGNPLSSITLVNALLAQDDTKGALEAAEAGINGLSEDRRQDEAMQFALGLAQVKAGKNEQGGVTLVTLLKRTENTSMMNSAAYELSIAGVQLELAESSVRSALVTMSEESKTWTLDENLNTLRAKSRLMSATWDTLGWILFREGKQKEAESYLKAAWLNEQNAEVGEHLGDLLAARDEKGGAIKMYSLALATIAPFDLLGVKKTKPTKQETGLRKKLESLQGKGSTNKTSEEEWRKRLQDERKFVLGPIKDSSGTAEYKFLIGTKGIERVMPSGEKEITNGLEAVQKIQISDYVPAGVDAKLVRAGMMNCRTGNCEIFMEP